MFCQNCGRKLDEKAEFCPICGTKVNKGAKSSKKVNKKDETQEKNKNKLDENHQNQQGDTVGDKLTKTKNQIKWEKQNNSYSKKTLVILLAASFVFGAVISGLVTYFVGAKPVLEMKYEYENKVEEAQESLESAKTKEKEAAEKYATLNNIKVQTGEPQEVKLQGSATVGVDIAPGMYIVNKGGKSTFSFYHYFFDDPDNERDFVWEKDGSEIILKAGEKLTQIEHVTKFTPTK